jgi:hypothetical protein
MAQLATTDTCKKTASYMDTVGGQKLVLNLLAMAQSGIDA